jgi:glycosyltransferase involved in cell wall biosynthesis
MARPGIAELLIHPPEPSSVRMKEYGDYCRAEFTKDGIPVLIAAHNEEQTLPFSLTALARQTRPVHPLVINNASEDATAQVAEMFGAEVIDEPHAGKVRALQTGIAHVLEGAGVTGGAILFTDADTVPVAGWAHTMSAAVAGRPDTMATGLRIFHGAENAQQLGINGIRTVYAAIKSAARELKNAPPVAAGHNMALTSSLSETLLESLMLLPNYFPGQDAAMRDKVIENGGTVKSLFTPEGIVFTAGDRYLTAGLAIKRLTRGVHMHEDVYLNQGQRYVSPYDMRRAGRTG